MWIIYHNIPDGVMGILRENLLEKINLSRQTLDRMIKRLVEKNLILKKPHYYERKGRPSVVYLRNPEVEGLHSE